MLPASWQFERKQTPTTKRPGVPAIADQMAASLETAANNDGEIGLSVEPTTDDQGRLILEVAINEFFSTDPVPLSKRAFAKAVADAMRDLANHVEEAAR